MDIVEIPTVVVVVFVPRLVAGLLRPRPSLKQIEQSSSRGKFRERHNETQKETKSSVRNKSTVILLGCRFLGYVTLKNPLKIAWPSNTKKLTFFWASPYFNRNVKIIKHLPCHCQQLL